MSMKSITTRPPKSRRRNWRATSSAASRLVLNAVSSMSEPRVARAAVDVHGNQGFGVVNHDGAAGWQRYGTRIGGFDLVLDLEARIQRNVVGVAFHAVRVVRHDHAHERLRLFKISCVSIRFRRYPVGNSHESRESPMRIRGKSEWRRIVARPVRWYRAAAPSMACHNCNKVIHVPLQFSAERPMPAVRAR